MACMGAGRMDHPNAIGGDGMTGRNSKPRNDGPAASPSNVEQFGAELQGESGNLPKKKKPGRCP